MFDRRQSALLLRGSILIVAFLTVWWFALANPLLYVLRCAGDLFGPIAFGGSSHDWIDESATGDWTLTIPANIVSRGSVLHSVSFDIPRSDVLTFTFSVPAFWAIALAVSSRRNIRPLVVGTLIVTLLETALLLIFVETSSSKLVMRLSGTEHALSSWCIRFTEYLVTLVLPYLAPLLVAIGLYPDLRKQLVGVEAVQAAS